MKGLTAMLGGLLLLALGFLVGQAYAPEVEFEYVSTYTRPTINECAPQVTEWEHGFRVMSRGPGVTPQEEQKYSHKFESLCRSLAPEAKTANCCLNELSFWYSVANRTAFVDEYGEHGPRGNVYQVVAKRE